MTFKKFCEHFTEEQRGDSSLFWYRRNHAFDQGGIDPVLLDIMLPGKNGDQVLKPSGNKVKLQSLCWRLWAIKKVNQSISLLDGANDYIVKPFDLMKSLLELLFSYVKVQKTACENIKNWKFSTKLEKYPVWYRKFWNQKIVRKRSVLLRKNAWFSKLSLNTLRKFLQKKNLWIGLGGELSTGR